MAGAAAAGAAVEIMEEKGLGRLDPVGGAAKAVWCENVVAVFRGGIARSRHEQV